MKYIRRPNRPSPARPAAQAGSAAHAQTQPSRTQGLKFGWQDIDGWFDFDNIYDLAVRRAGLEAAFCEIGAYKGKSTCFMAERLHASPEKRIKFTTIDPWDWGGSNVYEEFAENMRRAGTHVDARRARSPEAAAGFADESLDFVFIDGAHERQAVERDIEGWWPKVRLGGLMAGHDYFRFGDAEHPGVKQAVDAFVRSHGLGHAFRTDRSSWMIYKSIEIDGTLVLQSSASVLDALATAKKSGQKHVLIINDAVRLIDGFQDRLKIALARCPSAYDVLYLGAASCDQRRGCFVYGFDDVLVRAGKLFGLQAVVINMELEPEIRAAAAIGRDVDGYIGTEILARDQSYACNNPQLIANPSGYVSGSYSRPHWMVIHRAGQGIVKTAERKLSDNPSVSVICSTMKRQDMHQRLYGLFCDQTHRNRDLWVLDYSPSPSPFFTHLQDPLVHYHHTSSHLWIGEARNKLIEMSSGSVIAHFDDDDWYAPGYLTSMLQKLLSTDADLVKFGAGGSAGSLTDRGDCTKLASSYFRTCGAGASLTSIVATPLPRSASHRREPRRLFIRAWHVGGRTEMVLVDDGLNGQSTRGSGSHHRIHQETHDD